MLLDHLRRSIAAVHTAKALDPFRPAVWRAHGAGCLSDDEAQELAEAIVERARALEDERQARETERSARAMVRARSVGRSRDRPASLRRRRRTAASGWLPPEIAEEFTPGEIAVLSVVARAVREHGACTLPVGAIGAFAGVGRTLVKRALRLAAMLGFVTRTERRISYDRSDTTVVRIVINKWSNWLRDRGRGGGRGKHRGGGGGTNAAPTCTHTDSKDLKPASGSLAPAMGGGTAPHPSFGGGRGTSKPPSGPLPSRWTRLQGLEPAGP